MVKTTNGCVHQKPHNVTFICGKQKPLVMFASKSMQKLVGVMVMGQLKKTHDDHNWSWCNGNENFRI